ncbi:hypothetical protein [Verrucosispora sp. NA02020]|uniref:hypothetical protein n=1 Tax=Verrucosispora sp. NA02020 TaxID=2742132 RepID=UPI0015920B34|nr:hypothetical protein [Verrucosispora sp. NA02020]QKW15350.1 hypothetical protein HUT12_23030 [Verrucosispora sp. NA02020]
MTRYVCAVHKRAAVGLVGMAGTVRVSPTNVEYWRRRQAEVVALPARTEPIGEAA